MRIDLLHKLIEEKTIVLEVKEKFNKSVYKGYPGLKAGKDDFIAVVGVLDD